MTVGRPIDENQLIDIIGEEIAPSRNLALEHEIRLDASKRTLDQNYHSLDAFIDGNLLENPLFIAPQHENEDAGFEVLRLLHNYLASLYSFNETVRTIVNEYLPPDVHLSEGAITPASGGFDSYYGRRLAFLRGLRHDSQHGGFTCLSFDRVGDLAEFAGYHVVFDSQRFIDESGVRDPSRFLAYTNDSQCEYPLTYIARFHREVFQPFYEDLNHWFESR